MTDTGNMGHVLFNAWSCHITLCLLAVMHTCLPMFLCLEGAPSDAATTYLTEAGAARRVIDIQPVEGTYTVAQINWLTPRSMAQCTTNNTKINKSLKEHMCTSKPMVYQ